jgi:hypothetical protein
MAKKTPIEPRIDGVAVNFRLTKEQNRSIQILVAFEQANAPSSRKLSKAGLAKQGLLEAAKELETAYRKSLPANYVPLKA